MDWKKIGKKLLFPPIGLMVILVIASAVALAFVFLKGMEQSIPAYIVYASGRRRYHRRRADPVLSAAD